jgi:hypothetical protein
MAIYKIKYHPKRGDDVEETAYDKIKAEEIQGVIAKTFNVPITEVIISPESEDANEGEDEE